MKTNRPLFFIPALLAVCGFLLLPLNGCMVGPDYQAPHSEAPADWAGVEAAKAPRPTSVATERPADVAQWWKRFHDPTLTQLVEDALKTNLSLELAVANLRQARAARGIAVAGLWPTLTGNAEYLRETTSGVTSTSKGTAPAAGASPNLYMAGFDALWELDVFGGQRRNVESATANVQAAVENISNVQVTIAAEVALDYVQLRGYQQQIAIARKNLIAMQNTALITRQKMGAGFASALDVANAEASVATTEAQIPVFETSARQSIYALSILLARPPADLLKELSPTGGIPGVPAEIPAGLPSELLRRRPDIRQAEAQLHAATAQIGVATADLFPQFSLTGSMSWQSNLLNTWWTVAGRTASVGPSVTWPIFQGGAVLSNIKVQEALRDQAFITYRQTVLGAFQDVENALIAFSKEQEHYKSLQNSVTANSKAFGLSLQLYTEGLLEFLNVLVAQNALHAAENALVQSDTNISTDVIALYKALGGGWEQAPPVAALKEAAAAKKP